MPYIKGKGWFESSGKYIGSARTVALRLARTYGFNGDRKSFTRLVIESRVAMPLLTAEFRKGEELKQAGAFATT